MAERNYWTSRALSRRTAIRGAGVGLAGLAGAALIGCGGGDDGAEATATTGPEGQGAAAGGAVTATATEAVSGGTPVPEDQIKLAPGYYSAPVPPSPAELDPMVNGKYGGTLNTTYLDPPRMDINRTLSCTIYTTMNYTNNKLIKQRTGANAHPFIVEVEGDLAENWEASPDNTEFTFHLHQGIKTHNVDPTNGREYTSEDVKLSMERYQAGGVQKDVFANVTGIETPDDYTVKVTLDQPISDFPINLASWSFMWVKELIEDEDRLDREAIATGPYLQAEWTPKERSVFQKHPEYFKEGLPFIDEVITAVQSDTAALRAGFLTDNFFSWSARDDDDMDSMVSSKDTTVGWKFPTSRGANVNGWHFQMTNPKFQDDRVRHAISLGMSRDEFDLADNAGDNQNPNGAYSNAPMPWALLYDEYPDARANGQWYQFDPEQASQLLQAAGYSADNKLTWEHVTWYDRQDSGEILIPGLNSAVPEVEVSFRQVDNPTQVTLLSDRNFDDSIGIVWGPFGFSMDQNIFGWWHTQGGLNYNAAGNAELDMLLEKQRALTDAAEKKEVWQQVWDIIHDQVWDLWWPEAYRRYAWHNYALNYRPHGATGPVGSCYTSDQVQTMWLESGAPGLDR
ncbi:MAG: ABC transporter substrate-binding protein [Dehalococcoidia bacterium]